MATDIGSFLFKGILGMAEYPSSPFTGIILNDLVMFFLIPTVFIILIVYMLLARLVPIDNKGMRIMVGLSVYLFIVFGGYYPIFARLAGPYFIFLIFVLGLFYFILHHFKGSGGEYRAGGFSKAGNKFNEQPSIVPRNIIEAERRISWIDSKIQEIDRRIPKAEGKNEAQQLEVRKQQLEDERYAIVESYPAVLRHLRGGHK